MTVEQVKSGFFYSKAWTGNTETYHNTEVFEGYGHFCDVYFNSHNREIDVRQVEAYDGFKQNFRKYLPEIEHFMASHLKSAEAQKAPRAIDVIEIPFNNPKYDLALICGKTYRKLMFFRQNIDVRVEFKDGRTKSMQRKKDVTVDND